jgi:mannose-6-phosphate isomerase-like protein (cupin superfamily)
MTGVINPEEWAKVPGRWHGQFEGARFGAGISVIFFSKSQIGAGPRLHRHPYPETFIIRFGKALFTVADEVIEAHAGQILFVPAFTPHKFSNLGPEPLETIDIHASNEFVTEWLE